MTAPTPSASTGTDDVAEQVRRESGLVARIAIGAIVGAVTAVPFVLLLVLVLSESEWLARIDQGVAEALNSWALARPSVVTILEVVARATTPWVFRLAVLFLAALLWRAGSRRLATWAVTTMAVGGLLNVLIKEVVARARPTFPEPVAVAGSYSFPSGHAQNSMMGTAVLLLILLPLLGRRDKAIAWTLGVFVVLLTGFDRVGLGVHYLSDVVAGWVVALALVIGTTIAFGAPHRSRTRTEGLDETSSSRLRRRPDVRGEAAPAPAGVPALLSELRVLVMRLLAGAAAIWAVLVVLGLSILALDERVWPMTVDEDVVRWFASHRTPLWNEITHWMSWVADTSRIEISVVVIAVVFRLVFGRWRESAFVVAAVAVEALAFVLTTAVVRRVRPDAIMEAAPPTSSFPSGHTAAALALYVSIAVVLAWHTHRTWLRGLIWVLLLVPPLCVAYSRLYRGAHFPSDLVGSVVDAGLAITVAARLLLFASLTTQLEQVLTSSSRRRHAPVAPESSRRR